MIKAQQPSGLKRRHGFTILELMVIIAVVVVLAGLLLPALSRAGAKAKSIQCLNNQRQLIVACMLYASDHEDAFPHNLGIAETRQSVADGSYLNWVNNVMSWELDSDNTNTAVLARGGLGPYTSGTAGIYKCPSDFVLSQLQRDAGWDSRVRSYSMNAMVGNAGVFTSSGSNTNNPYYKQFFTLSQVPEPADIFVFIEEHPDSVRDGYFLNRTIKPLEWTDLPASYHSGGANLVFADGHSESHQWVRSTTKKPARADGAKLPIGLATEPLEDFVWLMKRTSIKDYSAYSGGSR